MVNNNNKNNNNENYIESPPSQIQTTSSNKYSIINNWSRGELIGSGAFGKVYLAIDKNTGSLFATKQVCLIKDIYGQHTFKHNLDSLRKEIELLSKLKHKNIVSYLGTSKSTRNLYVHLEYIEGGSLSQLIHEFGKLSLPLIQHYTIQILTGLSFLHSKGIVHRDIKPNNLLITKDGILKLADFGCSKQVIELSKFASYTGTSIYMSPESHRQKDVGKKADIWATGVTIIEMINGLGPIWINYTRLDLFLYISGKTFEQDFINDHHQILNINDGINQDCKDFIISCLKQNPIQRSDAQTLLNHSFIINKHLCLSELERNNNLSLRRLTSESSICRGIPNITRHISTDESV